MLIRSFQRRNTRRKRIFWTALIIWLAIIVWMVWGRIREYYHQQEVLPVKNLIVWEIFSFEGTIKDANKFPIYTHIVYSNDNIKIFLKSSSINLNSYKNQYIKIKGTIKEIYKGSPIVEVSEIKVLNEWLAVKDNLYIFSKDLLMIDFKNQSQLFAKRWEKEIEVYYDNKKIFSIERFSCSKLYKEGNCDALISEYEKNGKDAFKSYRWYTYYKHGEWLWTLFDENQFWYIFKNIEDWILLDVSSNIKIIDAWVIMEKQGNKINESCGFTKLLNWEILSKGDTSVTVMFNWKNNLEEYPCTIQFDIENERNQLNIEK